MSSADRKFTEGCRLGHHCVNNPWVGLNGMLKICVGLYELNDYKGTFLIGLMNGLFK